MLIRCSIVPAFGVNGGVLHQSHDRCTGILGAYSGPTVPSVEVLRDLHRAHLFSVPFENLDVWLRRRFLCDQDAFVTKIVNQRRGGLCCELNGAFAALLVALDFQVSLLSACVPREDVTSTPEFDQRFVST